MASCTVVARLALVATVMSFGCATPAEDAEPEARAPDCSRESLSRLGPLDAVFAFDNSLSSQKPSGIDADGDGIVGVHVHSEFTDPEDSLLGAMVASARTLIRNTADLDARFSIVTFAGLPFSRPGRPTFAVGNRDARISVAMTDDTQALETGLDEVIRIGSRGVENLYAGMRRANQSLIESEDFEQQRDKVALFLSDSAGPIFKKHGKPIHGAISAGMGLAVREARRNDIVIHSFGTASEAKRWRRLSLGLIGPETGGTYHAIEDPSELYCHLVDALVRSTKERESEEEDQDLSPPPELDLGE
ncbi:MAG: hypothetical protein GY944_25725 [bacterium]|nr:hypothetical protein [bacterium]